VNPAGGGPNAKGKEFEADGYKFKKCLDSEPGLFPPSDRSADVRFKPRHPQVCCEPHWSKGHVCPF
jgi:hypothetical protein